MPSNPVALYDQLGGEPSGNEWWMTLGRDIANNRDKELARQYRAREADRADLLAEQSERRAQVAEDRAETESTWRIEQAKSATEKNRLEAEDIKRKTKADEGKHDVASEANRIRELLGLMGIDVSREGLKLRGQLGNRALDIRETQGDRGLDIKESDPRRVAPSSKPAKNPYTPSVVMKYQRAAEKRLVDRGQDPTDEQIEAEANRMMEHDAATSARMGGVVSGSSTTATSPGLVQAPAAGGKVASRAKLEAFAAAKGMTYDQAAAAAKASGYTITD